MTRLFKGATALTTLLALALPATAADDKMLVFDWAGFEDENFYAAYIEKHGVAPSFTFFGDDDEAFQKINAGFRADVVHPCSQMVGKYRDAGLVEPWDVSRIPLFEKIKPEFLDSAIFIENGVVWYVPTYWGATAIAYRTDLVPEADVQTLQVFKDPKYAGRISLPDNTDDVWALALLATGVSDWTTMGEAEFEAAANWLREAHPNVRTYWADGAELAQLMQSGEVVISWAWNETPAALSAEEVPVAYQREAAEGSSTWFCGYLNVKDEPGEEDRAYDYLNAWLSTETANYIVNEWGYGHSNAEAMAAIDADTVADAGLGPIEAPNLAQTPMDNRLRTRMNEEFEKIKAGF